MQNVNRPRHRQAFLLALGLAVLVFLPFVIYDGGYFVYYGDFNAQQIPFYKLAHESVRSGNIFWSFYTDLGANFMGSYSFYLLFSPFFWLTLPFPTAWVPFLMAPLLVLKIACAALSAFCFIRRFVRDERFAVIGGLLYAFSGWMVYNVFFNHFLEVAVFFPLLLLGVEKLVTERKLGLFAVAVCINLMVNYWFFVGEAVFVALYVFVRMTDKSWGMSGRKFLHLAFEAVIGVGCAAFVLLPSVLTLMGNPRTGGGELVNGWNVWLYWHEQRQPAIIQSLFFPPDMPARPNFFPDHGAKWSSLSGWLPMIGPVGVIAYFFIRKRESDWLKKMLAICLLIALIPGLNSLFILLNNSYYARWFYMPVLLMAVASMRAVEDSRLEQRPMRRALLATLIIVLVFAVMCGLTPVMRGKTLEFGLAKDLELMWGYVAGTVVMLVATAAVLLNFRKSRRFMAILCGSVSVCCVAYASLLMASGKMSFDNSQKIINTAIKGREEISVPLDPFARSDIYKGTDNMLMYWHLPNIQAFHSVVPVSIMEFYPEVGVKRDVSSEPDTEHYALRPLLSVRWLFVKADEEEQEPMEGYAYRTTQNKYNIYENENFLPMGFAYDSYLKRDDLDEIPEEDRPNVMLRAIVLESDAAVRHADALTPYDRTDARPLRYDTMVWDVSERRAMACTDFTVDNRGFSARGSFDGERLVFFSVPWEGGWSATVNGQPAPIERANIGFMAVRVPAGDCEIRFDYMTPGLSAGIFSSIASVLLLTAYLLILRRGSKGAKDRYDVQRALFSGQAVSLSWDEFIAVREQRANSAEVLQQALNQAHAMHIKEQLDASEQGFDFKVDDEE